MFNHWADNTLLSQISYWDCSRTLLSTAWSLMCRKWQCKLYGLLFCNSCSLLYWSCYSKKYQHSNLFHQIREQMSLLYIMPITIPNCAANYDHSICTHPSYHNLCSSESLELSSSKRHPRNTIHCIKNAPTVSLSTEVNACFYQRHAERHYSWGKKSCLHASSMI